MLNWENVLSASVIMMFIMVSLKFVGYCLKHLYICMFLSLFLTEAVCIRFRYLGGNENCKILWEGIWVGWLEPPTQHYQQVQKNARPVHTSTVGQGWVVPSSGSMEVHPGAEPLHCFHGCRTEHILSQVLPNVVFIVLWNTGLCVRLLCFLERCLLCYGILMLCLLCCDAYCAVEYLCCVYGLDNVGKL